MATTTANAKTELTVQSFRLSLTIMFGLQQHVSQLDSRLRSIETRWMADLMDTTALASIGRRVVNRVNLYATNTEQLVSINGQQLTLRVSRFDDRLLPTAQTGQTMSSSEISGLGFQLFGKQIAIVKREDNSGVGAGGVGGHQPVWLVNRQSMQPLLSLTGKHLEFIYDGQLLIAGELELRRTIVELLEISQQLNQTSNRADSRLAGHLADLHQWPNLLAIVCSQLNELQRQILHCQQLVVTMTDFCEYMACIPKSTGLLGTAANRQ